MKKKRTILLFVIISFIFLLLRIVSAENLNLKISGVVNEYSSDVRVKTNPDSNSGLDSFDSETAPPPTNYSEFYSNITSSGVEYHLAVDSWNASSNPRTIYLIYYISEPQDGAINFSWGTLAGTNFTGTFTYYGDDATYLSPINAVDMRVDISYNYTVSDNSSIFASVVIGNVSSPDNPNTIIESTNLNTNDTLQNLTCNATLIDNDNSTMNVTLEWYNNSVLVYRFNYNENYINGTLFSAILTSENTTKHENWSCGMFLDDGEYSSNWINSSELDILNALPTVTLSAPADTTITTNRTPEFSWTGQDDDNDPLSYEINITCYNEAGSIITAGSVYKNNETIGTATSYIPAVGEYLRCLMDNNQNYNWSVHANDGEEFGSWANDWNFSIQSLVTISLPVQTVSFGQKNPRDIDNTTDDAPLPMVLLNEGNSELNITMNATDLFETELNPSEYFKYKIRNVSDDCFVFGGTQVDWAQVPNSSTEETHIILGLNFSSGYRVGCDNASIDFHIEVPYKEPGGEKENKTSVVTFISRLGESALT